MGGSSSPSPDFLNFDNVSRSYQESAEDSPYMFDALIRYTYGDNYSFSSLPAVDDNQDAGCRQTPAEMGDPVPKRSEWDASCLGLEKERPLLDSEPYSPWGDDEKVKNQNQDPMMDPSWLFAQESAFSSPLSKAGSTPLATPAPMQPPKKRKAQKATTKSGAAEQGRNEAIVRERNRLTAKRFREKKRELTGKLERQAAELEARNMHLRRDLDHLKVTISTLMLWLMNHAGCEDPNINQWVKSRATELVSPKPV